MKLNELDRLIFDLETSRADINRKKEKSDQVCFEYMIAWLDRSLHFLKPLVAEKSKDAIEFFNTYFNSSEKNTTQKVKNALDLIFEARREQKLPIAFYTHKYEMSAKYLFLSGLILMVLGEALTAYFAYHLPTLHILSFSLASVAIFAIFSSAAIIQFQKSKHLEVAHEELYLFNTEQFKSQNPFNLFNTFQELEKQNLVENHNSI